MIGSKKVIENVKAAPKNVNTAVAANSPTGTDQTSTNEFHQAVAVLAYQRAESRNFEAGHEMEDGLSAEAEVLAEQQGLKGFPA